MIILGDKEWFVILFLMHRSKGCHSFQIHTTPPPKFFSVAKVFFQESL